jgi:hypothetical protein
MVTNLLLNKLQMMNKLTLFHRFECFGTCVNASVLHLGGIVSGPAVVYKIKIIWEVFLFHKLRLNVKENFRATQKAMSGNTEACPI